MLRNTITSVLGSLSILSAVDLSNRLPRGITRIEPAGAGGASGACFNCDATNWAEGGRWRRSRHLRRVQRPRQGGMEMFSFPYRNRFKFPFLKRSFHEITNEFCSKSVQKRTCKKWHTQTHTHTNKQTESSRSEQLQGPCFGQPKPRYRSQMPQKLAPKMTSESR